MKRVTQAIVASFGITLAGSALAAFHRDDSYFDFARVDRVDRILATVDQPTTQQECWNEPRSEYHPGSDYRRETVVPSETAIIDGNQAVVRSDVVESGGYTTTDYQRICRTHVARIPAQQVIGYDVVYTYHGEDYHDQLDHDPGTSVRVHVENGYVQVAE